MNANRFLPIMIFFVSTICDASPIPVGSRKYVIRQQRDAQVQIVPETLQIDGTYMRDPESGMRDAINAPPKQRRSVRAESKNSPVIIHTEKTFKPLTVVGKLLQPSVQFEREYIDIAQLEAMQDKSFIQPLMESLDALE